MSAVIEDSTRTTPLAAGAAQRTIAFGVAGAGAAAGTVTLDSFLRQVRALAALLPAGRHAINLCEDRYRFLVAFCAVAVRGQVTLLPPSRAPAVIVDELQRHADCYCLGDEALQPAPPRYWRLPQALPELDGAALQVDPAALAAIGFTSGSTGEPRPHPKHWAGFATSTAQNLAALRDLWPAGHTAHVVATVPPQHMYGMELSVLLPLRVADVAVHAGRPFFPHDIARALHEAPAPRLLVTTPVHLRALLQASAADPQLRLPALAGIVSATAPLAADLAIAAETRFGCEVRELFGSTETCVIARRRPARDPAWAPLPGVSVQPQPDGSLVRAAHLPAPVALADLVALCDADVPHDGGCNAGRVAGHGANEHRAEDRRTGVRFVLCGRNADLLEIAGKRASLGDLTRKLQAIPGVLDGVVFQLDGAGAGVRRIAALAVAPGLDAAALVQVLRCSIDPVFLPRPLRCVAALPRNASGKLPREALLALLHAPAPATQAPDFHVEGGPATAA